MPDLTKNPLVVIIGVIGTILTICVACITITIFVTGRNNIPEMLNSPPAVVQQDVPVSNGGVTDQQTQCQWLQNNFPQSPEEVKSQFRLPNGTTVEFIYELCPSVANAFKFKANTSVSLKVPSGGCIDSWAGFTEYVEDVGTPVPDGAGGWRVFQGAVSAPEMTYRILGCN